MAVKYSVQGVLLWIRQLGTSASDSANEVATDGDGKWLLPLVPVAPIC